jgi:hypothetical protein
MSRSVCVEEAAASRGGIGEEQAAGGHAPEERADSAREESSAHHRSGSCIGEVVEATCRQRGYCRRDQIPGRTK